MVHARNFYGAVSGAYTGPPDITQFYFYGGILLLPLAIVGIAKRRNYLPLVLIVPALWYALGPAGGLYWVLTLLPGLRSVRAPVHVWFVVAMGLSLAAASGAAWMAEKFKASWLMLGILIFTVADVWYWNMGDNQLAYANASFAEKYGDPLNDIYRRSLTRRFNGGGLPTESGRPSIRMRSAR